VRAPSQLCPGGEKVARTLSLVSPAPEASTMQTPHRVSSQEFCQMREDWIAANCRLVFDPFTPGDQNGFQVCRKCGGNVEIVVAYMSLHDLRFGVACAGSGKGVRLAIPFCPRCEAQPAEQGCIHEPAGTFFNSAILFDVRRRAKLTDVLDSRHR